MMNNKTFFELLNQINDFGGIKSPDFIAYVMPLLKEVKTIHEDNFIAFIDNIDKIKFSDKLIFDSYPTFKMKSPLPLFKKVKQSSVFELKEETEQTIDLDKDVYKNENLSIHDDESENQKITSPVYLTNYRCWDYEKKHYDPLTDVFVLGQILASVAFGLDFRDKQDLQRFVNNRNNLFFLNKDLHPTLLNVIFEMTNLYREDRTANLEEVITKLENYREYNPENYQDLTETEGFRNQDVTQRGHWILNKLKNRLFDISRRNKLLYFKSTKSFLNLTISSVPLLLDYKNINQKDLIYWSDSIQKSIVNNQKLVLNKYLEFGQNKYLSPSLNKIRLEARKSKNEYGFSQLSTVIAFLNWYNFKEDSNEKISSPLILLPTEIVKKKGVKDQYTLKFSSTEAEINPILSFYLKDLYDLELPDFIDLETTSIEELVNSIQNQIASGNTGITLHWIAKPQLKLIHTIAKRNFNLKNKKLERRARSLNLRSFKYSYENSDFTPLGLQIFNERIKPKNNNLEYIINEDLNPDQHSAVGDKTRTFYSADNEGELNPTIWEINTCNITLGNFNYRKMSLVRDYNQIIDTHIKDEIFEQLFSEISSTSKPLSKRNKNLTENFPIISADPTQTAAIEIARSGESYIIQGPPGTGKSQTITNLIADYIARGKKILFVCEKRAALDVVYHRLKNRQLDEFCCLIHDSQADKKAFIHDLRDTYADFNKNPMNIEHISKKRDKTILKINSELEKLTYFHQTMKAGDVTPIELFEVLNFTSKHYSNPSIIETIEYPKYSELKDNIEWITEWVDQLKQNTDSSYISDYHLGQISENIYTDVNPKKIVLEKIEQCYGFLDGFQENLEDFNNIDNKMPFSKWIEQFGTAKKIKNILSKKSISIFDTNSTEFSEFEKQNNEIIELKTKYHKQSEENKNWRKKLSFTDTKTAYKQWNELNSSFMKYFKPSYYKLKNSINSAYNYNAHTIAPTIKSILEKLISEYEFSENLEQTIISFSKQYGFENYEEDHKWILSLKTNENEIIKNWQVNNQTTYVNFLNSNQADFEQLKSNINAVFGTKSITTLPDLDRLLGKAKNQINTLSLFIPFIKNANKVSAELKSSFGKNKWSISEFHHHLAFKSLQDIYEKERKFAHMDADQIKFSSSTISELLSDYYDDNVAYIRAKTRAQVLDKVRVTETVADQLSDYEKSVKKRYRASRRILENEFGKKIRYKSIRDLASSEAAEIMNSIKPVWLMSPLSVSDTMPISPTLFDVVIYDEASQITVEQGVPSLFRTEQTIIVGDEMQMPPTNFFSTSTFNDEEEDEIENQVGITLDADSLLNQGSRKLSSVMLGWHYRSRHESLISFSNAAFYKRSLLTIPDCKIHESSENIIQPIIDVSIPIDVSSVLDRSISFHHLENSVYEKRKNTDEANYIANVVSQLLKSKSDKSIGIVAFSMDQQGEIESALERLAFQDPEFDKLLEEEYQREDEDQFNGIFIKNLENVQGDERDIIIMSICYGYNSRHKMLMNFGPINRRGGEKRLNVIFSRAKKHMVIVSSILANDIKNDYNEGANYFKRFLAYAKHTSDGDLERANQILDGLHNIDEIENKGQLNLVVKQLKEKLESLGHTVDSNIGQSHFKCDLALRNIGGKTYSLGIIIDKPLYYKNDNIIEQYCQKPNILDAFGWKTYTVYSKDWLEKPERVLETIDQILKGEIEPGKTDNSNQENNTINDLINELKNTTDDNLDSKETSINTVEEKTNTLVFSRYEYIKDSSNKYWEIAIDGNQVIVKYGRIGNAAQRNVKEFDSNEIAFSEMQKRIESKIKKGYVLKR